MRNRPVQDCALVWVAAMAWILCAVGAGAAWAQDEPLVRARLLADVTAIKPGEPFTAGVLLKIQDDWHIYWRNPGEAGMATSVDFSVPEGFEVGELQFPVPIRFEDPGAIVGYGYEEEVMLLATITPPQDLAAGEPMRIGADTAWLSCERVCIMGEADLELTLDVAEEAAPANRELFEKWSARLPRETDERIDGVEVASDSERTTILVQWREPVRDVEWFPIPPGNLFLRNARLVEHTGTTTAIALDTPRGEGQIELPFVVAYRDPQGQRRGAVQSASVRRISE
jgi:DsbC/DsbD-like thiol-disulfide interchange protein